MCWDWCKLSVWITWNGWKCFEFQQVWQMKLVPIATSNNQRLRSVWNMGLVHSIVIWGIDGWQTLATQGRKNQWRDLLGFFVSTSHHFPNPRLKWNLPRMRWNLLIYIHCTYAKLPSVCSMKWRFCSGSTKNERIRVLTGILGVSLAIPLESHETLFSNQKNDWRFRTWGVWHVILSLILSNDLS